VDAHDVLRGADTFEGLRAVDLEQRPGEVGEEDEAGAAQEEVRDL
jgi:hypothetical protein